MVWPSVKATRLRLGTPAFLRIDLTHAGTARASLAARRGTGSRVSVARYENSGIRQRIHPAHDSGGRGDGRHRRRGVMRFRSCGMNHSEGSGRTSQPCCDMAVVCRTERLGTTVPAYSAVMTSTSLARHTVCRYCGARGVAWPRKHRRMRWRAGMRREPAPRPLAPTRHEALGLFFTHLDGHISRPPALLDAESVMKSGGLFAK